MDKGTDCGGCWGRRGGWWLRGCKGNSLLGWQQGLAWLEIVGSREGYECIHPFILPSIPIHSLLSLGYEQWAKWNPFVHSGSTGTLINEDLSLDHLGSINLSRSYEGTNSFSGQSSPIHAMGWQELLSKMQSTVAPPLAYAWPPRFIFVNPLPAGSPSRPRVEICLKELKSKKWENIELVLFSLLSSSF